MSNIITLEIDWKFLKDIQKFNEDFKRFLKNFSSSRPSVKISYECKNTKDNKIRMPDGTPHADKDIIKKVVKEK